MSQTLTISAPLAMAAVPTLIAIGGVVVGIALRGYLTTGIEVARLNAVNDDKTARWLWRNGYRRTPHAGPDITPELPADDAVIGEVLHVEHTTGPLPVVAAACCDSHDICNDGEPCNPVEHALPCCTACPAWAHVLSDLPHHDDEDAPHDDTDRPRWWATVVAFVVLAPVAFARRQWPVLVEWLSYRLKSQAARDAEFAETYHRALEQARDEEKPRGLSNVVAGNWITAEQTPEPEPVRIVRRDRYRAAGETGQFPYVKVAGAPRHAAPEPEFPAINATIPAPREAAE